MPRIPNIVNFIVRKSERIPDTFTLIKLLISISEEKDKFDFQKIFNITAKDSSTSIKYFIDNCWTFIGNRDGYLFIQTKENFKFNKIFQNKDILGFYPPEHHSFIKDDPKLSEIFETWQKQFELSDYWEGNYDEDINEIIPSSFNFWCIAEHTLSIEEERALKILQSNNNDKIII